MGNGRSNNNKIRKNESPPTPIEFICPITGEMMDDPVITRTGQTYERKAIEDWLFH